jgi:hypothetical protein
MRVMRFGAVLRLLAAASAGVGLAACTIGDVDLDGKSCPCPESSGLVCNEATQTCVDLAGCTPRFVVSDFGPAWTTPNNVRWEWQPQGTEDTFGSYAIELAQSAEVIAAGDPEQRLDQETLAELGHYALLNTGDVDEVVRASVTYGLSPDTKWYGRLEAVDRFGCAFRSPIAPATTLPEPLPGNEVVIFDDAEPPGNLLTSHGTFAWQADCDGDPCLAATSGASETTNLRLMTAIPGSDLAGMSPGQFAGQGFLELRIWMEDPSASFWTSIWVETPAEIFRFEPYSPIRTPPEPAQSSYRTVQIPLRTMLRDQVGTPMTYPDLTSTPAPGGLEQVSFGTLVPEGTRVWIDDIRVRW